MPPLPHERLHHLTNAPTAPTNTLATSQTPPPPSECPHRLTSTPTAPRMPSLPHEWPTASRMPPPPRDDSQYS
ncbi:hypothetical protein HYDPIDRAFT_34131 [Hydnomerulius pinastri MD-312]|uniref:Uncharacterized protein n=1 Tax=Hydnomerulius pinastri MD-312 TaxID=994086 RepID=A0A0C9W6R2_9AGAM|nr:hypothetical protein HYDPIDRAFT_34131 [Hydnomerulius pinastri MD-312]